MSTGGNKYSLASDQHLAFSHLNPPSQPIRVKGILQTEHEPQTQPNSHYCLHKSIKTNFLPLGKQVLDAQFFKSHKASEEQVLGLKCFLLRNREHSGGDQCGGRIGRELTSFYKYIKNTSTCGIILTKHLLNAGRRPQILKGQENLHIIRQEKIKKKKKKERKKGIRMGPAPLGGASEERAANSFQKAKQRPVQMVGGSDLHSPACDAPHLVQTEARF